MGDITDISTTSYIQGVQNAAKSDSALPAGEPKAKSEGNSDQLVHLLEETLNELKGH